MTCAPEFTIHVGASAPYSIQWTVSSDTIDLSSVSAAYFRVWRQDATSDSDYDEWEAQSVSATSTSCVAEYTYQAADLPERETIIVTVRMVTSTGDVFATPKHGLVEELRNLATCTAA